MMKLLIVGMDAVSPDFIRESLEELPYLNRLIQEGISSTYKSYVYGYGSRDNWISMYTGLSPEEHGVTNNRCVKTGKAPVISDYSTKDVFWNKLNESGYKVGTWKLYGTMPPASIDGYMASGDPALEPAARDPRVWSDVPQFSKECSSLSEILVGNPLQPPMPKGPEAYGYTLEELQKNPKLLKEIMTPDYFEESLDYLEGQLAYHLTNITRVNEEEPVDVFWFYDAIYDFISHFVHHDPEKTVLLKALQIIDRFTEQLVEVLEPENIVFVSDHGQLAFGDHFPNTPIDIRKEAFGLADQSIFVEDSIFLPARNGGFLTSVHSIDATFIAAGPLFKSEGIALPVRDMRTIDIYPLLLEALDCKVPNDRKGYIPDILEKESYVNESHRYPAQQERKRVLLLANMPVYEMNAFINQYFLRNRFHDIYIFADQKYKETYEVNPLVIECFTYHQEIADCAFDCVIVPTTNNKYTSCYSSYHAQK